MTDETTPLDYAAALAEAQRLGYAEADPSGDVEGLDAVEQAGHPRPPRVRRLARPGGHPDASRRRRRAGRARASRRSASPTRQEAREAGRIIRLLATASIDDDGTVCGGRPADRAPARLGARPDGRRPQPDRDRRDAGRARRLRRSGRRRRGDLVGGPRRPRSRSAAGRARPGVRGARRRPGPASGSSARPATSSRPPAASGTRSMTERRHPARGRPTATRRALPPVPAGHRRDAAADARRGLHAARPGRRLGAALGLANLYLKVEGQNPTGSFKDRGMVRRRRQGRRGRRAGDRLRVDRQHVGVRGGLWCGGRDRGHRRPAEGPDRGRQAAPGARRRRPGRRDRRQLRPGARDRAGARRTGRPSRDPGQLGQSVPPRGPEDRRLRDLRRPRPRTRRARHPGRQRRQHQRLLGRASASTRRPGSSARRRGCGASRRPAPRRSWSAIGSSTRRRSRPRSGSAIPPRGRRRSRRATRRAAGSRAVTDDEILAAYRALARYEGIFCEPASAASVAGVTKAAAAGELDPDATVVCVLTGHGLKDPTTAERQVPPFLEAEPTVGLGRRGARLVGRERWPATGSPNSMAAGSPSRCRRRRPTSARATTASASPSRSSTGSSSRSASGAAARSS